MSTQQLSDVVRGIVNDWVQEGRLFTALDVSLSVKQTMPYARHREVRELVRLEYNNMQNSSYGKTDIDVTLDDGSAAKAILYHPLSDSWDLDKKYGDQQRSQTLKSKPVQPVSVTPVTPPVNFCGTTIPPTQPVQTPVAAPAPATNPNKPLWDAIFSSAHSLFPTRR